MKLFSYWRSSSSWRVRIALAFKSLPYEYIAVHLTENGGAQHRPEYRVYNPLAEVPSLAFECKGQPAVLTQSVAILEFLEEMHPEPALLPKDVFLRAKTRQMMHVISSGIQPMQNLVVLERVEQLGGEKVAWVRHWIHRGLAVLEDEAKLFGGKCMVQDSVTMADVCLVPQLATARRFGVDFSAYPTLVQIDSYLAALPAFIAAAAEAQPDAPKP